MTYMLLIYQPTDHQPIESADSAIFQSYLKYTEEVRKAGAFVGAAPLVPTSSATTVRVRDGKRLVTDGPFAETTEWLGGYYNRI